MKFKKVLASTLSAAMVLSCGFHVMADEIPAGENTDSTPQNSIPADTAGHWAEAVMLRAAENGILIGNGEGYNPDGKLTRAELAAFMTRVFNASEKADISNFTDVDTDAWYADDVAEAVNMKILAGSDNAMRPNDFVTRQEAIAVFARAICLEAGTKEDIAAFTDASLVADWALADVAAMVKNGYIEGSGGKLSPNATMTRAEFAVILDKAAKAYAAEGTFESDVDGSLMIKNADVTVKDSVVSGNVIIGDGVGEGDATLDGVTVKGDIIVRGGGVNSVKLINGTVVEGDIVVNNVNSAVRLYADSLSDVIASIDANTPVILDGVDAGTVIANADVEVASGTVKEMIVNADGVKISGEGKIEKAVVNADNVTIDNKGVEVEIAEGVTGTVVNGEEIDPGETPDKPFVPGGNTDPGDDQETVTKTIISAIPAPLHDTSNAIEDDKLFTAGSYKVDAYKNSNEDFNRAYIYADGLKFHQNGDSPTSMGYWVGVGIPAPEGFTEWSGVEYKFDDAADFTAANMSAADYTDENGSYFTLYFNASNTNNVRNFTIKWNAELTETYVIDFSGVTIDSDIEFKEFSTVAPGTDGNGEPPYQLLSINYNRKVASSVELSIKKGDTEIFKAAVKDKDANENAYFQWSYRDFSSVLGQYDEATGEIPMSAKETIERGLHANDNLLKAGDVVTITLTSTTEAGTSTISTTYTITEADVAAATSFEMNIPVTTSDELVEALSSAVDGNVILVKNDITLETTAELKAGIELVIEKGASLTIAESATLTVNGTLLGEGVLKNEKALDSAGKFTISRNDWSEFSSGTYLYTFATINFDDVKIRSIYSIQFEISDKAGKVVGTAVSSGTKLNNFFKEYGIYWKDSEGNALTADTWYNAAGVQTMEYYFLENGAADSDPTTDMSAVTIGSDTNAEDITLTVTVVTADGTYKMVYPAPIA